MPSDYLPPDDQAQLHDAPMQGKASQTADLYGTPGYDNVVRLPWPGTGENIEATAGSNTDNGSDSDNKTNRKFNNDASPGNVINLFTGAPVDSEEATRIVRVCAETNGARMLYATLDQPERLVAVPILCWALLEDGTVSGMVPWLDEVLPCLEIEQKYSISWEGYYCAYAEEFFFDPPAEITAQLGIAARFNGTLLRTVVSSGSPIAYAESDDWQIVQEIPDPIGTHALLLNEQSDQLVLTSVISWTLDDCGRLHGMLADDSSIEKLPVLPGDNCLFCAEEDSHFKCFFQRDIAEQIRLQNPETMQAIEQLFGN